MGRSAAILRFLVLALLALAAPASAQRAVVLELEGDPQGRLRGQVVDALVSAGKVALLPVRDFHLAVARKGIGRGRAERVSAVRAVARSLQLDAVVDGVVRGNEARLAILDPDGQELWSRQLPLRRGLLVGDTAERLAAAIAAAAAPQPPPPPPPPLRILPEDPPPQGSPGTGTGGVSVSPPPPPPPPAVERELPPAFEELPRPELVRLTVLGHTIWRAYCARPGVDTCREWGQLDPRPPGETQDFIPDIPYSGARAELEAFPMAPVQNPWVNGIGFGGHYGIGFSLTTVRVSTPTSTTEEKQVLSTDTSFAAHALYRVYFALGADRFRCHAGARAGVMGRLFDVDREAVVPVAGSHRVFGMAGVDLGARFAPAAEVEASVWYFHDPHAGQEDLVPYGSRVSGRGIGVELGVRGDLSGPLGYSVRGHMAGYGDVFSGRGLRWTEGGAAEELYLSVTWGLSLRY